MRTKGTTGAFAVGLAVLLASSHDGSASERQGPDAEVSTLVEIAAIANGFDRNGPLYALIADADRERIERWLADVEDLPETPYRGDISRVLYVRFASLDPAAAVDHALQTRANPAVVSTVFRAWAHVDLAAAVGRAAELPTGVRPDAARALLQLDLPAEERESIAERLGTRPAVVEISKPEVPAPVQAYDVALSRIGELSDHGLRRKEAMSAASAWAEADPASALAAIFAWESDGDVKDSMLWRIMYGWAETDARAAMDWLLASSSHQLPDLVSTAFWNLAKSDLADAEALVATLPSEEARRNARWGVFGAIQVKGDFDRMLTAFADLDARDQSMAVSGVVRLLARESPERAFDWLTSLDQRVREEAFDWSLASILRRDPALTKELIRGLADPGLRIKAALAATRLGNVGPEDLHWAESLGIEAEYAPVVGDVFYGWFGHDAQGASAALRRYSRGPARDDALDRLVGANLSAFDPQAAERLFDAIESPAKRRTAARRLHRYYTQVDPNERKALAYQDLATDEDS
ncbi:MAG: hypothetical protein F4X98_03745 [Gammaproteobacteria bacterium]|nr:hypothetical protein [Gammaproteobacteria bacterium]